MEALDQSVIEILEMKKLGYSKPAIVESLKDNSPFDTGMLKQIVEETFKADSSLMS